MKKILVFLLLFGICINGYCDSDSAIFSKCIDGDTAIFIVNNESVKVRFLAIDTPELLLDSGESNPLGKKASDFTCNILTNAKTIKLEYDPNSTKTDNYDRVLAWIWTDDNLLQKEIVKNGWAEVKYIYNDYLYVNELKELELEAKTKKLGIFSDYIPKEYTVTFKDDNMIKEVIVNENEIVEEYIPSKLGYKFIGWYLYNNKFDFNTKINNDITLNAHYKVIIPKIYIIIIGVILILLYILSPLLRKEK